MNYLEAGIRGVKFQKTKSQIPKKEKYDAGIGEFNPSRFKIDKTAAKQGFIDKKHMNTNL